MISNDFFKTNNELHLYANKMGLLLHTSGVLAKSRDLNEILQVLSDTAAKIIENGSAAVYLSESPKIFLGATTPALPESFPDFLRYAEIEDHPNIQKAISTKNTVILPDTQTAQLSAAEKEISEIRNLRTIIYIPLIGSKGVLGVYIVGSVGIPCAFSKPQLTLWQTLSAQAAIAIENANLYNSLQKELEQRKQSEHIQSTVYKIAESANTLKNLEDLFHSVHKNISKIMPAENFFIALYDSITDKIHFPYFIDQQDSGQEPINKTEGLTGYVFRTGKSLLVTPSIEQELLDKKEVTEIGSPATSWLGVPLKTKDSIIGVIAVQSYTENTHYWQKEKEILEYVSAQVATVIQRKQAEDERNKTLIALKESEERYRLIVENANDGIEINQNNKIIYANNRFACMLGYTNAELSKLSFDSILTENAKSELKQRDKKRQKGENLPKKYECTFYKKDKSLIYVEINYEIIQYKGAPATFAIVRDITDRKLAQAEMMRLTAAIEQAGEAFVISNPDGSILYVNPAFEQISGYKKEEILGKNPRIFKSGEHDESFYGDLWKKLINGESWRGQIVNKRKDGTNYTEDILISPVRNEKGDIIHYLAVKRDITEQLRMSEMLSQAQKMEVVGRLAGGVAHDFNNLLTVINGYSELLLKAEIPGVLNGYAEQIKNAGDRATRLTSQLLAFSKKQVIQPRVFDLNILISEQLKMLNRLLGEDVVITTLLKAQNALVRADYGQIEQVIMNIIVNARDAMPKGGKLTIETHQVDLDEEYFKTHVDSGQGTYIMLAITDNGIGMDDKIKAHIFEPFFTTKGKSGGTGLGLSIVYGIIRQSQGSVYVYSEQNKGTTFKIYLPLIDEKPADIPERKVDLTRYSGTETILLVEDDTAVQGIVEQTLTNYGYNVLTANNGEEGLFLYSRKKDVIDLILTDVIMPFMGGKELSEKLLEKTPELKIIFFSGYTDNSIINHGILHDKIEFLQKPFSSADLVNKVRMVLDKI